MVDQSAIDLNYGQFGAISYNNVGKKHWSGQRSFKNTTVLHPVGHLVEYLDGASGEHAPNDRKKAKVRYKALGNLTTAFPELVSAATLTQDYLHESSNQVHGNYHQAAIGDLLAFGRARGHDPSSGFRRMLVRNILAVAGGTSREGVRIIELQPAQQGWDIDRSVWISTLDLGIQEAAWCGEGGPRVLQICFADGIEDDTTLLALRFRTSVSILRPLFETVQIVGITPTANPNRTRSRINPNLLTTLTLPSNVNEEFADVTFNPWYQQQVATVNSSGRWFIWTLQGKGVVQAETLTGMMRERTEEDEEWETADIGDWSWHKISWIGNAATLIVCDRHSLRSFTVSGRSVTGLGISLLDTSEEEFITDIRKSPFSNSDFFVTTTSFLYWFRTNIAHTSHGSDQTSCEFSICRAWRHHRDSKDHTLRVAIYSGRNETRLLLYSQQTPIMTEYCIRMDMVDSSTPLSLSDPTVAHIVKSGDGNHSVQTILVIPAAFQDRQFQVNRHSLSSQYQNAGYHFSQVFSVGQDLSLVSQLCYSKRTRPVSSQHQFSQEPFVSMPIWKRVRGKRPTRKKEVIGDEFIVQDENLSDSGVDSAKVTRISSTTHQQHSATDLWVWTVPYELVYQQLLGINNVEAPESLSLDDFRQDVESALHDTSFIRTIYDALPRSMTERLVYDEIAELSEATLLRNLKLSATLGDCQALTTPSTLGFDGLTRGTITPSILDRRLLSMIVKPLPQGIPAETRSGLRTLAKEVSTSLFFSSIRLRPAAESMTTVLADGAQDVRFRAMNLEASNTSTQSGPNLRTHLPTPRRTPSAPPIPQLKEQSTAARRGLHDYVQFNTPFLDTTPAVMRILDHWTPGSAPADYDSEEVTAMLGGTTVIAGSAMSATDLEKQQRQQARHEERQQDRSMRMKRARLDLGNSDSQPAMWMSSQARVDLASQESQSGVGLGGAHLVSQQDPGQQFVASQVEPGRFGGRQGLGRLPVRNKGPRKAGF